MIKSSNPGADLVSSGKNVVTRLQFLPVLGSCPGWSSNRLAPFFRTPECVLMTTTRLRSPVLFPIVVLTAMLLWSSQVISQDLPEPVTSRFEISPLVTYRSHLTLPVETGIEGSNPTVVLDGSPGFGIGLGLRLNNSNLIEVAWSRQDSYARIENSNAVLPATHVTLNQVHCNFSQEYGLGHRAPWLRPFLVGSVGATTIDGTSSGSIHLSVGIGGGIRILVGPHLGFRMQAQWLPIFYSSDKAALCDGACLVNLGGTVASQAEFAVGPIFRF